ncbi:hypothetical protein [Oceanicella actignis]|uniref:ASCH domain-containing protein n=1 Tax=Oceanicella actignis TaxID=1189325 RepID=A0A1M7U134_9RHOB|nr:hypothetical protein [Oceanicella actignis]SET85483.1 hypothetical protein SAMN04488119_1125 [Oceanicella actignis]SHN76694.1 hypothetical protein SAMN05216200_11323 [Oceanicella actignis]
MKIAKGLIVADPWIGYILDGSKTWEMRSTAASLRGWFGLIRKGTGAVWGVARLVDVLPPLSPDEMLANIDKHRIPEEMIRSGEVAKWNTPWVLADVRRLARPVPYRHLPGAVTWVTFEPEVSEAIAAQLGELPADLSASPAASPKKPPAPRPAPPSSREPRPTFGEAVAPALSPSSDGTIIGRAELTEANIKNNHFYLRSFIDKFPSDVIGGSNAAQKAPREMTVDWGGATPAMTDIDGQKKFFRSRGWIRTFFERTGAQAGDVVCVEQTGPYACRVSLEKRNA